MLRTTARIAKSGALRRTFVSKQSGDALGGSGAWQSAKGNMTTGDLRPSNGVVQSEKINGVPFLGKETKIGRDRDRKDMTDTEDFSRDELGKTYLNDNNLSMNHQHIKKQETPKESKGTYVSPSLLDGEQPISADVEDNLGLMKFGTKYGQYDELRATSIPAEQAQEIRDSLINPQKVDMAQMQNGTEGVQSEKNYDEKDYVSKWAHKDGLDIEAKWQRDAKRAHEHADDTIPSNSSGITSAIMGNLNKAGDYVASSFIPAAESFGNAISSALDNKAIGNAFNTGAEKAKGVMEATKSGVASTAETVKETVVYAAESIPSLASKAAKTVMPMASNLMHKAEEIVMSSRDKAGEMAESVKSKASEVADSASSTASKYMKSEGNASAQKADLKDMEMEDTGVKSSGDKKM